MAKVFKQASYFQLFNMLSPAADMFTGGKISGALDEVGDRAAAMEIFCTEAAEMFAAVKDAARNGLDMEQINFIIAQAKDVPEAIKLIGDPSLYVEIDGEQVTADDDAPSPAEDPPEVVEETPKKGKKKK